MNPLTHRIITYTNDMLLDDATVAALESEAFTSDAALRGAVSVGNALPIRTNYEIRTISADGT